MTTCAATALRLLLIRVPEATPRQALSRTLKRALGHQDKNGTHLYFVQWLPARKHAASPAEADAQRAAGFAAAGDGTSYEYSAITRNAAGIAHG